MKATRKVSVKKRRAAFVESEVNRWNRPDHAIKQVTDGMESLRVFLKNTEEVSMLEYGRLVYLRNAATSPEVAKDFVAIKSSESLCAFLAKYDNNLDTPLDLEALEAAFKKGLISQSTAEEMRGWLKEGHRDEN
jgi:hypothetical protein